MHSGNIELAVAMLLNYRVYTIVPNVSWGLFLNHECDMLALDNQSRFTEIEIKISASDLKADFKKKHGHKSKYITRLIYAMPKKLCIKYSDLIPKECGIISVEELVNDSGIPSYKASYYRQCRHSKSPYHDRVTDSMKLTFMRLGCMRIWTLKAHNNKRRNK